MRVLIAAGLLLLVGCADGKWVKPGGTQAEFQQTRAQCANQSAMVPDYHSPESYQPTTAGQLQSASDSLGNLAVKMQVVNNCLVANGWHLASDGEIATLQAAGASARTVCQSVLAWYRASILNGKMFVDLETPPSGEMLGNHAGASDQERVAITELMSRSRDCRAANRSTRPETIVETSFYADRDILRSKLLDGEITFADYNRAVYQAYSHR